VSANGLQDLIGRALTEWKKLHKYSRIGSFSSEIS
jgi:hypothetical protein